MKVVGLNPLFLHVLIPIGDFKLAKGVNVSMNNLCISSVTSPGCTLPITRDPEVDKQKKRAITSS